MVGAQHALVQMADVRDPGLAALMLRPHAEALADAFFAASYATDIAQETDPTRKEAETEALAHFCQTQLGQIPATRDRAYAQRIRTIASLTD